MKKIAGLLLLAALSLILGCASAGTRAEKKESGGTAEGFLTISGEKVALQFSYAVVKKGQTSVIISDKPVPAEALESNKRLTELGEAGELSAIKVFIDSGKKASEVFFYDSRLPSGLSVKETGTFTLKYVTGERLSGTLVMDDPGFSFGYNVSFSAGVCRIADKKPVSPGLDASPKEQALAALKNQDIDFNENMFRRKVQDGDAGAVKLFLQAGMPTVIDGEPAIALAVEWGHAEVTQVLIDAGADVNFRGEADQSLVMQAASTGKLAVLDVLIRAGADVNTPNSYKIAPLAAAAEQGRMDIVQALIKAGARVNARSTYGGTALQVAVLRGYTDIVEFLINSGADVARDREDLLDIARRERHRDIEKLIIKAAAEKRNK
jgi:hypothetical protein